jgi:Holliday junction DNA helicase RuvA
VIAHLRGTLADRDGDVVVIECGGVGYRVMVTAAALRLLPALGAELRLYVHTHFTQDAPWQLFGFAAAEERRLFETLLAVQGVGPKVAVAILSGLPPADLVRAISAGDIVKLTQIRGVGRKIAERLSVELRDKIAAVLGERDATAAPHAGLPGFAPKGRLGEVHGALLALGYKPVEIEGLVGGLDPEQPAPDLIKQALAALRRK